MDEFTIGLVYTGALLVLVFGGVRVFAAAAIVGLFGTAHIIGWDAGAGIVGTVPHSKAINYVLSVLPMFILIGFIAYHAGLTHALFNAARAWVGWVPGGLAVASVVIHICKATIHPSGASSGWCPRGRSGNGIVALERQVLAIVHIVRKVRRRELCIIILHKTAAVFK